MSADGTSPARAALSARRNRALALWAVRWVAGLGLALAIVVYTGRYQWLPWAAAAVALASLAVILVMHRSLVRRAEKTPGDDRDAKS